VDRDPAVFIALPLELITVVSKHFQRRHGRACPGHSRLAALKKGVDARDKRGHDAGSDSIRPETTLELGDPPI
jgi:hypothetical protein